MDKKPTTKAVIKKTAIAPKIQYRENIEVDHHLFKSTLANCLKGDKYGPLKIKSIEHVHFFHTVNSNGQPQQYTSPVAGHVHQIKWGVDSEGNLVAECGPALRKVTRVGKNGVTRSNYEPVKVTNYDAVDGEPDIIPDDHKHKMVYMGSDRLSKAKIDSIKRSNREEIGQIDDASIKTFAAPKPAEGYQMSEVSTKGRDKAREQAGSEDQYEDED